ncbi:hypothetical protein CDV31_017322 [Fusarium ambrosium]|uniref:Uncharacterized protein n=1 Tax=Fusarium ambrosium TaxID=131363 RepID=A0A428RIV4_9HYPO|nr:hypothetical protein CDV31_017322 [Fusarium ambrosium]
MKTDYNFEASIRPYWQRFDIWDIGKYECKRRQRRRSQCHNKTVLPPPLRYHPALNKASETSDPGSSPTSSCVSEYAVEHVKIENRMESRGGELA